MIFIVYKSRFHISKDDLKVELKGKSEHGPCRVWTQLLDRHDGSYIARYKMFHWCDDLEIHVTWKGVHVSESPYKLNGRTYPEHCDCPLESLDSMLTLYQCPRSNKQIDKDLQQFDNVDFSKVLEESLRRFSYAGAYSFCHYAILKNQVGEH